MYTLDYDINEAAKVVGIDTGTMMMLIGMLVNSFEGDVGAIGAAIDANDMDTIYSSAHRLKGSASNLGFKQLAEACLVVETAGKMKEEIDFPTKFEDIKQHAELITQWHATNS